MLRLMKNFWYLSSNFTSGVAKFTTNPVRETREPWDITKCVVLPWGLSTSIFDTISYMNYSRWKIRIPWDPFSWRNFVCFLRFEQDLNPHLIRFSSNSPIEKRGTKGVLKSHVGFSHFPWGRGRLT